MSRRRKHRMPTALKRYWASRRSNPHRKHHRRTRHRYSRNPLSLGNASGTAKNTVMDGVVGAAGALANDFIYTYGALSVLPTSITSTNVGVAAAKLLGAVLIGMFGGKLWSGKGAALAAGAATVALHDLATQQLTAAGVNLSGLGGMGAYMSYGPAVGSSGMSGLGSSAGKSVARQLTRRTMGGNLGAYMSRTGVKVPKRGMGAYMSGVGDTTFANGIPTG